MKSIKQQFKEIGWFAIMLIVATGAVCFAVIWIKWVWFLIKFIWNL